MMIGQQVVAVSLCYWLDVLCIQIQKTVIVTFVAKNGLSTDSAAEDVIELASEESLWCWHELDLMSVEMKANLAGSREFLLNIVFLSSRTAIIIETDP